MACLRSASPMTLKNCSPLKRSNNCMLRECVRSAKETDGAETMAGEADARRRVKGEADARRRVNFAGNRLPFGSDQVHSPFKTPKSEFTSPSIVGLSWIIFK